MEVKIENIRDDHINQLEEVADKIITINLNGVRYLSSYIITRLLLLNNKGKRIELVNANSHIKSTIKALNIEDVIQIK